MNNENKINDITKKNKQNNNLKKQKKNTSKFNSSATNKIFDSMNKQQIKLDDTRKYQIEFLLRYICFKDKISINVN
mgnify:CR=1 FL=1